MQFQRPEHAFLPPRRAGARADLDVVALAAGGEAGVGDDRRPVERSPEHRRRRVRFVAALLEERPGRRVAVEEAGRAAAAVQAERERVERRHRPGEEGLGAAAAQVVLGPRRQLGADAPLAVRRDHRQQADDAGRRVQPGAVGRRAEAGQDEADQFGAVGRHDQPRGVEIRLGEYEIFQKGRRAEGGGAARREARIPHIDQAGRVEVDERTILDHGGAPFHVSAPNGRVAVGPPDVWEDYKGRIG